jgi:hypothetical protein
MQQPQGFGQQQQQMQFCTNCGAALAGARFCGECGQRVLGVSKTDSK